MKPIRLGVIMLAVPLLLAGCKSDMTAVSVRFGSPPNDIAFAEGSFDSQTQLVADDAVATDDPLAEAEDDATFEGFGTMRVTMEGEPYNGTDVTETVLKLEPGVYRFSLTEYGFDTPMQGTIQVNPAEGDLVDMFQRWKANIPESKKRLAYRFELDGKTERANKGLLRSLLGQIRAYDSFERQLDDAIQHEARLTEQDRERTHSLLDDAIVHVFADGQPVTGIATRAAFDSHDFDQVRSGESVTKMLLVVDYRDIQMKLELIDQLGRNLQRCRNAARDEARRLEGRKQLYSLIFKSHDEYLQNEEHLQQALEAVDRLDAQLANLRERRLALAYAGALVAPEQSFRPLDVENRDLEQELTVLRTEKERLDAMFTRTGEINPSRVTLQRRIQQCARAMEDIENQLGTLADARAAIERLRDSTTILRRQGASRLLAASCIGTEVPCQVRDAVQREACMTIRLETVDGRPVEPQPNLATYQPAAAQASK